MRDDARDCWRARPGGRANPNWWVPNFGAMPT